MPPKFLLRTLISLLFLRTLIISHAYAQIEDLTKDAAFFEQQKESYQRWLDHSGLGQTLHVYDLQVNPDHLWLYLAFPVEDIDYVVLAWNQLKADFERERPLSLEQLLFYKMTTMMEVRQSMADVQIHDTYDPRKNPLFSRAIYFEDGLVKVEKSDPRSKIREVAVTPADLRGLKKISIEEFKKQFDRARVFDNVYNYAHEHFERNLCEGRNPKVRLLENEEVLRFEVADLCREVLTDEANPVLCRLLRGLGYDCNWVKRELLTFTVIYRETETGFRLGIEIDGKYGSGLYEHVHRGGYLSMEIDFDDYLERYADSFRACLRQVILNGKANCD